MAFVVAACYTGPNAAHYATVLDGLDIPSDWTQAGTELRGPGGDVDCSPMFTGTCPAAARYYFVDADPADVLAQAEAMATAAGFEVDQVYFPECDGAPSGPACTLNASLDPNDLQVNIHNRGESAGAGAEPRLTAVRITADTLVKGGN
jgi:hypothetical protein